MVNGTGNGIGIGPPFKGIPTDVFLFVILIERNPEGRIEKPH